MPVSSWLPLQSKLRMVVWQNTRRSHVKLKNSQIRILFYLFDELISESRCICLAIDRNLPRRLVVRRNPHLGRWQAFEKMQQNFNRVITRIECRSQCLPIRLGGADELRPGQCAPQAVLFETGASPDKRTKEREEQRKRHLSTRAAFAILSASSIVSGGGASSPAADSI